MKKLINDSCWFAAEFSEFRFAVSSFSNYLPPGINRGGHTLFTVVDRNV